MQGGSIDTSESSLYGSNTGTGNGYTSLGEAGHYQFVVVAEVYENGNTYVVVPDVPLMYAFSGSTPQRFQVLIVPFCDVATIDHLTPVPPWNGSVGGVLAVLAKTIQLGDVSLNGKGFRGGPLVNSVGTNGGFNSVTYRDNSCLAGVPNFYNGPKGEGFIGRPRFPSDSSTTYPDGLGCARGAPGNAGGGGNYEDGGGGGGANAGRGGDGRVSNPSPSNGIGGAVLPLNASQRLFLGTFKEAHIVLSYLTWAGGGGGGVSRNSQPQGPVPAGLSGGGLLYLHAFTSIVPIGSLTPNVELNGNSDVSLEYDGGPGGK